jgi:hypothetical protein
MSLKFQSAFNALERINGRTAFTNQSASQSWFFRDDPSNGKGNLGSANVP